jgi:ATP-dependent DNA helicase RecQ
MPTASSSQLLDLLKENFGFEAFRPLQEEIVRDALEGKDVFALLPTGGGKSLCYQLPALAREGLTVVVSPLIALMKDQVDALQANGIAATFLNSSLAQGESRPRLRGLHNGEFRLLYVAPERLMLSGFLEDLQTWNINLLAIDEAHCISEWGHDFRPEYRQLASLRDLMPNMPIMALTATATERVRVDIVKQLKLRDTSEYVASFNRPNLTYRVTPRSGAYNQTINFIKPRGNESGIIYCASRKATERVAAKLVEDGVNARPYHAGLAADVRARNQEAFIRDEVKVMCATIAFGMGIDKPNVRFVIHYDLPKNVEGYYQETGRAGRDGLPSDCLLLFSAGDVVKFSQFIDEKDPKEQEVARKQLQQIVHYAESSKCRRVELLNYFGEEFAAEDCGACDNCLDPRETFDGTIAAQKFLSCVIRIYRRSGFSVGLNHVVEVLTGADTEKVRKWGHEQLSTYGIGTEHKRPEWAAIGRELVRLGFLAQTSGKFSTLQITQAGADALAERQSIELTRPTVAPEKKSKRRQVGDIACDEILFESLRKLRKRIADELDVAAYIVFSDVSLRWMARDYPTNGQEFARISGVGARKLSEFGSLFMSEIARHLQEHPRQAFADDSMDVVAAPQRQRQRGRPY